MSHHFSMGAINKVTKEYEYPRIAQKIHKYICPECKKDVNFCKGKIKQPYFAHKKSETPCYYYDKPSESQIHKDAKQLLKSLLTNKTQMNFYNVCNDCQEKVYGCCELFDHNYEDNVETIIEYRFEYNNSKKSADVALIKENNIVYIFEICYKNKTRENARPEPWVEINAEEFICDINNGSLLDENGILHIQCIRDSICNECEEDREKQRVYFEELNKQREIERKKQRVYFEELNKQREIERKKQEAIRIKRELLNKMIEIQLLKEKELEHKKQHEKVLKDRERQERLKLESDKFYQQLINENNKCEICNINYCKCVNHSFIKNEYGIYICIHCKKRRCKCVKITNYFKQINI